MKDFCQDKVSPYNLKPEEAALFKAAIGLADWLVARPDATPAQLDAIGRIRQFLQDLPKPPPLDLHGEFGFEILPDDDTWDGGHLGAWEVSVCRAMFEIYYAGNDEGPEFSWILCPGCQNHNDMTYAPDWIQRVSDPMKLLQPGQRLILQASTWNVVE